MNRPSSLALAGLFVCLASHAATGEQWEYTQQMDMMGMKMPMPAVKVCEKPNKEFQAPIEPRCQAEVVKKTGARVEWKMKCGAPEPMEGKGWSERKGDQVTSEMHLHSANGDMDVKATGRKLGACTLPS